MSRILLLGGYGGFGARIARRLAADGHEVLLAGRSAEKAQAFCQLMAGLTPLVLDRSDIAAALFAEKPDLVVDASGPFQAMDYAVPRACIIARIPYCDIADGRDFVCGIRALDAEAKAAGIAVVSGASSVPALSGAVVRELAKGLDRVRAVEMAISASNRAAAGPAVAAAILGQVGKPLSLWRGGRTTIVHGWQDLCRMDFVVPGVPPIEHRQVAVADVPDLALLPDRLPGRPAVTFRAGTELAFQNFALWLASWPVRWGWLSGLSGLARWLLPLQSLTARLGGDRSAMTVRVFGDRGGDRVQRQWTLIADRGDGPEIPALSVPLLVRRMLAGEEAPGARDAGLALELADYQQAFGALAVQHAFKEVIAPPSLYRRIMGTRYDAMAPAVQAMHDVWRDGGADGEAEVVGPANWLGRIVARVMRFPPPGRHKLHVSFMEREGVETWTRDFGAHSFCSHLSQSGTKIVERFGAMRFYFDLPNEGNGLTMQMRGWSFLNLPLPLVLAPRSIAREWEEDGCFHFDVSIALPLIGRIVHYRGLLHLEASATLGHPVRDPIG